MVKRISPRGFSRIAYLAGLLLLAARPVFAEQPVDVTQLINTASVGSGKERLAAIDHLSEYPAAAERSVRVLRQLLSNKDPKVRWRSARALGDLGVAAKNSVPELRNLLKDEDPIVQYHAAVALGKLEDKSDETVQALVDAATSKDGRVARASIAALRNLKPGPQRAMAALKNALNSNDQAVMVHALEAVVEQRAAAVPLLKEALTHPETAVLACTAIEQIGPDAAETVPDLTKLISDTKHSQILIQALLALAAIGPAANSAAPQIESLLDHETDATVPVAAAFALGSIGAKDADSHLKKAMAKDDPFLQMIAAWAIAKTHPDDQEALKTAVNKLVQGLRSSEPAHRVAAARSLQSLHAPPELVAPALVQIVNDPDPDVQTNAVEAVASLGESIVPRVSNALRNPQLQRPAIRVLKKLGPKASGAVDALVSAAADAKPADRAEIFFALAAIGPKAAPATDMLAKAIFSKDDAERESALFALRKIGPKARGAVRPLIQRMKADDSFASYAAAWALVRIAPDEPDVITAVVPKLASGMSSKDEQIRQECSEASGELRR